MENSKYIWCDSRGDGRNLFCMFRRNFTCVSRPLKAVINIFADTIYELHVNGKYVNFGPVRFAPRFPLYDSHDISKFIRPGRNSIAVLVNYFGCKTYKSIPAGAGMIAWGGLETGNGEKISFDSNSKDWLAEKSSAYDEAAPKMSFALNPLVIFDQEKEPEGWRSAEFDDSKWKQAVEIEDQKKWGELMPRNIPFMSGSEILPDSILRVLPLKRDEDVYSFKVPFFHFYEEDREYYSNFIGFSTWIFSEKEQVVTAGMFWGEHWLNGKFLENPVQSMESTLRLDFKMHLNTGWNYFFGKVGMYLDEFTFYMALPRGAGLHVSATKEKASRFSFRHSPVIKMQDYLKHLKNKPLPYPAGEQLEEAGGWVLVERNGRANNPGRESDWNRYGDSLPAPDYSALREHVFRKSDFPDGFALVIDLGYTMLVRPEVEIEGVENAIIDFAYSEQMRNGRILLYTSHNYHAADRFICSRNTLKHCLHDPRGMRYMLLTVRNPKGDVRIKSLKFYSASYPVEDMGAFKCSEPLFNEIWEMCRRTQRTDMEDAYVDCTTRERGMYGRDTIIQYHNNLAFFGDHNLMSRCLELFGQSPAADGKFRAVYPNAGNYTIADFALNMVEGYWNYFENSGDMGLIKKYWPEIQLNLEWFHKLSDERSDGLLDADWPKKHNVNSIYGGFHGDPHIVNGHMKVAGVSCAFTAMYLSAVKSAERLSTALGDLAAAGELNVRFEKVRKSLSEAFWDHGKNCFADDLEKTTHSYHCSLLAVRAGATTYGQDEHIRNYFRYSFKSLFVNGHNLDAGVYFSPHFTFYILDGLYRLGLCDIAEKIISEGWGAMLSRGVKTCMEYYNRRHDSHSHAWSASPGYYLSKHVLGINFPNAPDLNLVEIKVNTSSVSWAEGTWPHPEGLVNVKWKTEQGRRIFNVEAPKNVRVCVI